MSEEEKGRADDDIKKAVAAYRGAFPSSKPKITMTVFEDQKVQLFLSCPDQPHMIYAQGNGVDIEEAALDLRRHLAKGLTMALEKLSKHLTDTTVSLQDQIERLGTNALAVDVPTSKTV